MLEGDQHLRRYGKIHSKDVKNIGLKMRIKLVNYLIKPRMQEEKLTGMEMCLQNIISKDKEELAIKSTFHPMVITKQYMIRMVI
jgi:hypothetical protein